MQDNTSDVYMHIEIRVGTLEDLVALRPGENLLGLAVQRGLLADHPFVSEESVESGTLVFRQRVLQGWKSWLTADGWEV